MNDDRTGKERGDERKHNRSSMPPDINDERRIERDAHDEEEYQTDCDFAVIGIGYKANAQSRRIAAHERYEEPAARQETHRIDIAGYDR